MSEQQVEQPGTGEADQPAEGEQQDKQPEVDWKAKAREWEKRAKENRGAAERLAELERAQMTEQERTAARLREAEQAAEQARAEALRFRIATRYSVSDEDAELFLTGKDEDTLTRQAERLAKRVEQSPRFGDVGQGPRPPAASTPSMNDLIRGNLRGR